MASYGRAKPMITELLFMRTSKPSPAKRLLTGSWYIFFCKAVNKDSCFCFIWALSVYWALKLWRLHSENLSELFLNVLYKKRTITFKLILHVKISIYMYLLWLSTFVTTNRLVVSRYLCWVTLPYRNNSNEKQGV